MILIKEEMIGGEKWRRAIALGGSDAIVLWLALKCYCSQHPDTEGFVPGEVLDGLPGAPRKGKRALEALLGCGRLLPDGERGPGLVEGAQHGWKLHDYLDHAPAPEEIALRREKERLRKRSHREGKRAELAAVRRFAAELDGPPQLEQGEPPLAEHPLGGEDTPRDTAGHVPRDTRDTEWDNPRDTEGDNPRDTEWDNPGVSLAGARPPEGARGSARVRGHARAPAHPNPTLPNPTKKSLARPSSTIRDPVLRRGRLEPGPAHQQFALAHGIELAPIVALVCSEADASCLSADEAQARLGELLEAAAARGAVGGAA